ncbi:MAG: carboxypeptidase regulatory-like domain-containing protein [Gemmatimonadaceae bacterium]
MLLRFWFAAGAGALVASQTVTAQRGTAPVSIRGVAYDSLRGEPLRNAFIAVVGTARSAHSDARGHFRVDSVPPGVYVLAAQHDVLDSLGLSALSARADVTDGRDEVRIAVPSFATLWRAACGPGRAPPDSGFVYGTVRDASTQAPVADAFVDLTWIEIRIDKGRGVTQRHRRVETRTDASGRFSVCGVPVAHWLRIGAGVATAAGGPIDLPPGELRVQRRDLLIGPATRSQRTRDGTISGVLTDAGGAPVADARVIADDTAEVRSRADGSFVIHNVAAGTRQIEILSIGMRPIVTAVDVLPNDTATLALQLHKVTTLDVVRVTASRRGRLLAEEIEERRKGGMGYLMDVGDIARRSTLSSVFSDLPSMRVEYRNGNFTVSVPDGRGGMCEPDVWVDGALSAQAALNMIQPREIAAVEVFPRAGIVPTRYRRDLITRRGCGAILVWTNWALGRS